MLLFMAFSHQRRGSGGQDSHLLLGPHPVHSTGHIPGMSQQLRDGGIVRPHPHHLPRPEASWSAALFCRWQLLPRPLRGQILLNITAVIYPSE